MRRLTWLALLVAPIVAAVACGGSDGAVSGNDDGGGGDGGSNDATVGGNDGGGGSDGGGSNDGGGTGDVAVGEAGNGDGSATVDGGLPSDPGAVSCGASTCTTSTQYCCIRFEFDGGVADASCVADDAGGAACQTFKERCNEAADCDAGSVCCAELLAGGSSTCRKASTDPNDLCGAGGVQLCRTNTECATGVTCNVVTCGNRKVQVCGVPQGCSL